jgi:hypothetical protein
LATVLTSSEFNTLGKNIGPKFERLHIAMYRGAMSLAEPAPGTNCVFARNNSYFYTKANPSESEKLSVNNTWIRNRANCAGEDTGPGDGQCLFLWQGLTRFADEPCATAMMGAVCQVTGRVEAYRRIDDVCLTETPLASKDADGPEACMEMCRQNDLCRSVNFKENLDSGNTCELFPWWYTDKPSIAQPVLGCLPAYKSCTHYTYVPRVG